MKKLTKIGNAFIKMISTVMATAFLIYGLLMLWDMYRTEIKAFASYDLLKFRPSIEENEPPYLDDLVERNPDTRAWLTIYNTNIDYPVMQGKDDWEYLNKNALGEFSVSGSIYMSSENAGDFSDEYTLLYGHHMENGSMFGDIGKFKDKDFFEKNSTGVLIMQDKAYDINIEAFMETDAFDPAIFEKWDANCLERTLHRRSVEGDKIIALSTCDERAEFSRNILLCRLTPRKEPLPSKETGESTARRTAVGHPMAKSYWAVTNLFILVATIYAAVRLVLMKGNWKNKAFVIGMTVASFTLFVLTEDMHKPMQVIDAWTPVMIFSLMGIWLEETFLNRSAYEKIS